MGFKQWLSNEAVNVPPHMPHQWWAETKRRSAELEAAFKSKKPLIEEIKRIDKEFGLDALDAYDSLPFNFRQAIESDGTDWMTPFLSVQIDEYDRLAAADLTQYLKDALKRLDLISANNWDFKPFVEDYTKYFRRIDDYWEKTPFNYDLEQVEEDEANIKKLQEYKSFLGSIFEYIKLLKRTQRYISAYKDRDNVRSSEFWSGKKVNPQHKEVEILYHATPYVREILAQGFKTKEELGGVEALGGATDGAISFTADIQIARAIVQALRDVINIAQGKLKINDIMKMAHQEGMSKKDAFSQWSRDMKYRQLKLQRLKNPTPYSQFSTTQFPYDPQVDDLPVRAFDLYKNYLTNSKLRYNPLFFGVRIQQFEHLDPNNVGVLACKVNMTASVRYLMDMEEFRIPTSAIMSVRQVK